MRFSVVVCVSLILLTLLTQSPVSAWAFMGMFEGGKELKPVNGVVTIPAVEVNDAKAHFFKVADGGASIEFFVLKSPDGKLRTAFNACDVCFPEKKGYVQEGENMVCVNCGNKFHASRVGEIKGGCNPGPLKSKLENGALVIQLTDLQAGARYFKDPAK